MSMKIRIEVSGPTDEVERAIENFKANPELAVLQDRGAKVIIKKKSAKKGKKKKK